MIETDVLERPVADNKNDLAFMTRDDLGRVINDVLRNNQLNRDELGRHLGFAGRHKLNQLTMDDKPWPSMNVFIELLAMRYGRHEYQRRLKVLRILLLEL